ncbi:transglutaminase [Aquimarina sp. 2201CG1-2-11]|uniref:transglutaminase n=1 Tax=Aquimarina discodermiae TaxID=3231043 RepID=UPI0034623E12
MKRLHKIIVGIVLFCSVVSTAQQYKYGKVSKEELLETSYQLDKTANAAVLYESKRVFFEYIENSGFVLITEVFKRVKLYNKEGYEYATDKISLYKSGSNDEEVSGLKGVTYSLIEGKIVETKLKKDGVFREEISEYRDQVKFTMPTLTEGSVIEYKYKIRSPFVSNIDPVQLQYEIPIKKIDVQVEMPEYFNFKKRTVGYLPINLSQTQKNGKINFVSKARSGGYNQSTSYSNSSIDYTTSVNTIKNSNVPAFKIEPYSGNIDNYISSVVYELQYTKFPNRAVKNYSTTWEDVTNTIYNSSKFGGELKKTNYFKEEIDPLIAGINDPKKRVALIYDFVKKKMSWNKRRGVRTQKGVKTAYKEQVGNVADINLMLLSMLTYAKLDANPVLVSTSDRIIPLFPTREGFNYIIVRVKFANGDIFYLDATDKYGSPNILPNRVIQGAARVIAANGTSQYLDLRPKAPSINQYMINYAIDNEGLINGKVNVRHKDYLAHSFRVRHGAKDNESNIKRLQKKYEIPELLEYELKGVNEIGKGVNERFGFELEDQVEMIENELFFSPLLFLKDSENVFKSDERKYPVDFGFGYSNSYMVTIKIPEGYEVAELPKSEKIKMPDGLGTFSFISSSSNGAIQLRVIETVSDPLVTAEDYPILKEFFNKLVTKENEQIVLKKI